MSKYVLEFELEGLPKMTNESYRSTWQQRMNQRKIWKKSVMLATLKFKPPKPLVSAALTLTRVSSNEPDFDGLTSGFKHVIDGLVESGIIASDKMSCIGQPTYKWEAGKRGQGRIKIKVEGSI